VRYCISAGFFAILWDLHHLEEVMENGASGTEELLLLKTRLHMFMDTMKELLMSGQNQTYVEEVSERKLKLFGRVAHGSQELILRSRLRVTSWIILGLHFLAFCVKF
jgi:hypothetical protein